MNTRWCFTLNNPNDWTPNLNHQIAYLVYQLEEGEAGTPHLQGYVRFTVRKRLATVKTTLGSDRLHIEPAFGTEEENRAYCTKEPRLAEYVEFGEFDPTAGIQGKRNDLDSVTQMVTNNDTIQAIAAAHPKTWIRYHQGIQSLIQTTRPPPPVARNVKTIILWGPTGTGKTHRIMMNFPDVFSVVPGRDPFGQYKGQKQVLFDEFDDSKWTIQQMNQFTDKWRLSLDCRYNNRFAEWEHVFICSNTRPSSWWPNNINPQLRQAFDRRITDEIYVDDKDTPIILTPILTP